MAIDPRPTVRPPEAEADSPIDNELAAYRALSPLAVLSFVFGLTSILVFTSLNFAVLGGLAIVCGLLARRQIRKLPDVLTGAKLVEAGIGLALVFTLAAFTISGVQSWIYGREAAKFARTYVDSIREGTLDDLIYFQASAQSRAGKSHAKVAEEMKAGMRDPREFEMSNAGTAALGKRLVSTPRPSVEFAGIDSQALDGMTLHAGALVKLSGGAGSEPEYAILHLQGNVQTPGYAWFVKEVQFPHKIK